MSYRMLILIPVLLSLASLRAAERPNVIVLVSDDQRHDTIHALGNSHIQTPNLDKLVADGTAFTHAYCQGANGGAVCVPSRAMFLSGRSFFHLRVDLPPNVPIWPGVFQKAGYVTHGIGKWHNGPPSYARAFSSGAAIFFGGMTVQTRVPIQDFDPTGTYDEARERVANKHSSELFADAAIKFLREYRDEKPFLLYVAFTSPHDPRTPPPEFAKLYDPAKLPLPKNFQRQHPFNNGDLIGRDEQLLPWPRTPKAVLQEIAAYYGMISHLDAQVGRIRKAVADSGREKNTIVVFFGDHGLAVGQHGLLGKQNLYEHSMRPPLVIAGPGVSVGKKCDGLCYLFDIYPTICELTGVRPADAEHVDGRSLVPIITGERNKVRDVIFGAYCDVQRSVRTERWKLIRYPHINKSQLFDLNNDADEIHDVAGDRTYAGKLGELTALLKSQQREHGDRLPLSTDRPAPVEVDLTSGQKKPR